MVKTVKRGNQGVTNSVAFQYDTDLHFPVQKGEMWEFDAFILYSSPIESGLRVTFQEPEGATFYSFVTSPDPLYPTTATVTRPLRSGNSFTVLAQGVDTANYIHIKGVVDLYSTDPVGTQDFTFMFGQAQESTGPTIVYAGSYLLGTRLIP